MTSHGGPPAEPDAEPEATREGAAGGEDPDVARATPPGEERQGSGDAVEEGVGESTVEVPDPDPTVDARTAYPPADPTVELREPERAAGPARAPQPPEAPERPETSDASEPPGPAVVDLTAAAEPTPPPADVTVQTPPPWARPPVHPPAPAYAPPPVPAYGPPDDDDEYDDDEYDEDEDDEDEWAKARHRHRRQTVTFAGGLAVVLVVGLLAYLTFLGRIPWPFGGKVDAAVSLCTPSKPLAPKTVTLRVYNGSSRKGLATSVTRQLQAFGFVVEDTGNDPLEAKLKTPIQVRHGDTGALAARTVAAYLVGKTDDVVDDRQSDSVDVVLGPTFTRVKTRKEVTASLAALSASLPRTCPPGVTDGASPSVTGTSTPHATGTHTSGPTKRPAPPTTTK